MQINLIETPKRAKDASINSYEIDRSKAVREKIFEKAKFNRLKAIILKSITKDIEVIIRNELLCNKYTLANQSSNEIYKKVTNKLREELKNEDFIIKDLLQTMKEIVCLSLIHYILHV